MDCCLTILKQVQNVEMEFLLRWRITCTAEVLTTVTKQLIYFLKCNLKGFDAFCLELAHAVLNLLW